MVHQIYYPVALDLLERPCLVVGGGRIAEEKIDPLLRSGAEITVISPEVREPFRELERNGRITLHLREYQPGDIDGYYLVIAATDSFQANAVIAQEAREKRIFVNAVDDPPNCDFFAVSIVRRNNLQVSISTNGLSPAFARWMREHLDETLPEELGDLLDVLGDVRSTLKERRTIPTYEYWKQAIDEEVLAELRAGNRERAYRQVFETLTQPEAIASAPTPWREG